MHCQTSQASRVSYNSAQCLFVATPSLVCCVQSAGVCLLAGPLVFGKLPHRMWLHGRLCSPHMHSVSVDRAIVLSQCVHSKMMLQDGTKLLLLPTSVTFTCLLGPSFGHLDNFTASGSLRALQTGWGLWAPWRQRCALVVDMYAKGGHVKGGTWRDCKPRMQLPVQNAYDCKVLLTRSKVTPKISRFQSANVELCNETSRQGYIWMPTLLAAKWQDWKGNVQQKYTHTTGV